jgi:hypothetical protein
MTYKLKLPHPTEGGVDQAAASEKQKKKKNRTQPLGETTIEFWLKYQHQDDDGGETPELKIRLKFHCS